MVEIRVWNSGRCGVMWEEIGSEGLASSSERELNVCLINESEDRIRDT